MEKQRGRDTVRHDKVGLLPLVLLVDDDEDQLILFQALIERLHCRVVPATSATTALDILRDLHIDMIVCDVRMPLVSGKELIQQIRRSNDLRHLPIVAFSAVAGREPEELLECGANYFCPKMKASDLLGQVSTILSNIDETVGLLGQVRARFSH